MKDECLICKAPLEYLLQDEMMECAICHKKELSKTRCGKGHYVCSQCHTQGMDSILGLCLAETSTDPIQIIRESYSAGTETQPQINQDAVRLMREVHGIDMEREQYSKPLSELPAIDIVVTMGCNVQCPTLPCSHREDWGLDDPTGQPDEVFLQTIQKIEENILNLKARLKQGRIDAFV